MISHGLATVFWTPPKSLTPEQKESLELITRRYAHLLNTPERRNQTFSWQQFAQIIKANYSMDTDHNSWAVEFLNSINQTTLRP